MVNVKGRTSKLLLLLPASVLSAVAVATQADAVPHRLYAVLVSTSTNHTASPPHTRCFGGTFEARAEGLNSNGGFVAGCETFTTGDTNHVDCDPNVAVKHRVHALEGGVSIPGSPGIIRNWPDQSVLTVPATLVSTNCSTTTNLRFQSNGDG
jgi:hypothetical protein